MKKEKPTKRKESANKYHANKAVSRSMLHLMSKCPAHYKYVLDNGNESTAALFFGTAVHAYILERKKFNRQYIVAPDVDRRTSEGKAIYQELMKSGKTIISQADADIMEKMYQSVMSNKYAQALLSGEKEKSYYWTDDFTKIRCKCRPDCRTDFNNLSVIVDFKSCLHADTETFMREALKYGYDLQASMYKTGVETYEQKPHKFVFIAVEKQAPFAVNILEADEIFIRKGYDDYRNYLGMLKYCRETDNWYGYTGESGRPNILNLPAWLLKEFE